MTKKSVLAKTIPLQIVGSNKFGRNPKISNEQTFNMFISDGWLVSYAGYKIDSEVERAGEGRGTFTSTKFNKLIFVINDHVYARDQSGAISLLATIDTFTGDVFIAENNAKQIAICDRKHIYIYNYGDSSFKKANIDFIPNYLDFHDTYFISCEQGEAKWRLSNPNNGLIWDAANTGEFETKADKVKAVIKIPGRSSQILVMGEIVTEPWLNVGAQLFPYQRSSSFNIDYGVANEATISSSDTFVVWLGINEKSGLALFVSDGGSVKQISTDGINSKLNQVVNPRNSYGFLFRQDGHLFYQFTFPSKEDNFSFVYDFTTNLFYSVSDEYMDSHIAKSISYFNDTYYFVSFDDGNLYEMNTKYTEYAGKEIPRVRVCPTFRLPDGESFVVSSLLMTLEQGVDLEIGDDRTSARVDMSISRDGASVFSSYSQLPVNPIGVRRNEYNEFGLGYTNEFTPQFRFWGHDRFLVNNGVINIYQ